MSKRRNYLSIMALTLSVGVGVWLAGCSQSVDVPTSITSTVLNLSVERLPTTPKGMIYELWAGDTASASGAVSLGKFFYNYDSVKFYDETMRIPDRAHERSNEFVLNDDLLRYSLLGTARIWKYPFVFVTINKFNESARGPVMLIDRVGDPNDNPIELVFPMSDSLWTAAARVNFQAVSGRSRLENVGKGVWFSSYRPARTWINDTFIPDDLHDPDKIDTTSRSQPNAYIDAISNERLDTIARVFGKDTLFLHDVTPIFEDSSWSRDTIWQIAMRYDAVYKIDSAGSLLPGKDSIKFPRKFKFKNWRYTNVVDSNRITLDIFTQDNFGFPKYGSSDPGNRPTGWRYKGWVVSPYIPRSAVGAFTPPAWKYKSDSAGSIYNFIPGDYGGLFSTGTFYNVGAEDDDGNRYGFSKPDRSLYSVSPPYPGGDFLDGGLLRNDFGLDSVQFMPKASGNEGTVFITLEPENYESATTNFPLIMMMCPVPSSKVQALGAIGALPKDLATRSIQFPMDNKTSHVKGSLIGFPQVNVALVRR